VISEKGDPPQAFRKEPEKKSEKIVAFPSRSVRIINLLRK